MSEKLKVIEGQFGKKAVGNLAADLRLIADAVDRGEVVEFVAAYVHSDQYQIFCAASNRISHLFGVINNPSPQLRRQVFHKLNRSPAH